MVIVVVVATRADKMFKQQINSIQSILRSKEPLDCFRLQFKALKILGAFRDPTTNIFLKFLSIFPWFLVLKLCVTSTIYLIADGVPWDDRLQSTYVANTSTLCAIKMYLIGKNQVKLEKAVKQLKSRVNDMNDEETEMLHKEAIYPTAASYMVLQSAILVACTIYPSFPIGKNNEGKLLPVFAWYPHYFNVGTPHKIVYFLQEMSLVCAGSLWVCVDTINFGLLAHQNVMLKILNHRVAKLGWTDNCNGSDYHTRNYEQLCECIKYHVQISSYQSETNEIYGSILFAKITLSVLIVCSYVYALGLEHEHNGGFVAHFLILCVIVGTLFVLSWMSDTISVSSNNLLNTVVECNFQCMDRKTTKALVIFMQGLNATVCIEVGEPLSVKLNLKMFVTIMEFAYKCLALLRTAAVQT